ncbi:aldehyde dehydrogenase (NADP(+)) [Pseudonocardia humida]|uniref:Aldehyde dehydrogenase (NADP(+)) n=1 Tax=Pseudonocardia humida TaxID=2800819 RepID=A0ABT1A4A5_9PSEU|nr:aldehyde dehydrogenase family protein [Pseudonocardia humida]MCO1657674.1 aldehyde dehydrogenase (NADP(+)) [Pseudonocardia humida]
MTAAVVSTDPRTGESVPVAPPTTDAEVEQTTRAAADAAAGLEALGRSGRAELLRAAAARLEANGSEIVATADLETAIGPDRLKGELARTTYQLRMFAEVAEEGSYLEATIDHAGDTPMGPGPDLRRMLVPLGPVAVFGASNFPLAFSVPGGDTASALAAGCPVVAKAHESHPATSLLAHRALREAAEQVGAPEGTVGIVLGREAGARLVADPRITAVGFTGSLSGARALQRIIDDRPDPIPFYGELSSINPLVVTEAAAAARGAAIAEGLVGSFTMAAGQLCTKPGLAFVPVGAAGDALVARMAELVADAPAKPLLNARIHESYAEIGGRLAGLDGVEVAGRGATDGTGFAAGAALLTVAAADLRPEVAQECFGPIAIAVRYDGTDDLLHALRALPSSLAAAVHAEESDDLDALLAVLRTRAGRVLFDGYPTGVLVAWAQTHGGPWPSTNTVHTSVGPTAIRRFLRPLTWQNAPERVLPPELRDAGPAIPRRIDGVLRLPR